MNEFGDELAHGTFKMPSLNSVFEKKSGEDFMSSLEQRIASNGIIRLNADINDTMTPEHLMFDEEKKVASASFMSLEKLKVMRNDGSDFYEIRFELNEDALMPPKLQSLPSDPDAMSNWDDAKSMKSVFSQSYHSSQSQYYDVQRLIIQERGEQRYNELRKKKTKSLKTYVEDKWNRDKFVFMHIEKE